MENLLLVFKKITSVIRGVDVIGNQGQVNLRKILRKLTSNSRCWSADRQFFYHD
jgi:hypothetical protein